MMPTCKECKKYDPSGFCDYWKHDRFPDENTCEEGFRNMSNLNQQGGKLPCVLKQNSQ